MVRSMRDGEAVARDGTRLWYRVIESPRGGTPLVFANGAACSIHYWPLLVEYFAGRVPLILFDYRGHGRSGRAAVDTYEIPEYARDLLAVLDAEKVEKAALVGHSMGVQVILEAYRAAPERVAALVPMFGTFGDVVTTISRLPGVARAIDRFFGFMLRNARPIYTLLAPTLTWKPSLYLARLAGSNLELCPESYLRCLMEHIQTMEPECIVRTFASVVKYSAAEVLPNIDVPTLIFAGAIDRMTPVVLAERMAGQIPKAELAVVDHGSHLAMLENPGFVHCRFELFLRDHGLMQGAASGVRAPGMASAGA
jgi:pimeloyl-ACP methyl ester carboxylesterase